MPVNRRAIVLLSGGLDSEIAMALAQADFTWVRAITFDYGQRARREEIRAASAFAAHLKCPHEVVDLSPLKKILSSALDADASIALPNFSPSELGDEARCRESARAVWVPNRNGLFLNMAAALAEKEGADWLVVGFNREEAETFPDNSAEFVDIATLFFHFSTQNGVRLASPTLGMTKTEIVKTALDREIPLHLSWSCYEGAREKMCGKCESCARAIRAFRKNGLHALCEERFAFLPAE